MRDSFPKALKFTLSWEGGYSNDPDDPGGETFKGMTVRDNPELKDKIHNQTLTDEEAGAIYIRKYWLPAGCNELPYPLDCVVFDMAVNMGVVRSTNAGADAHEMTDHLENLFMALGAPYGDEKMFPMAWPYLAALVHAASRMGEYEILAGMGSMRKFRDGWRNRCFAAIKTFV